MHYLIPHILWRQGGHFAQILPIAKKDERLDGPISADTLGEDQATIPPKLTCSIDSLDHEMKKERGEALCWASRKKLVDAFHFTERRAPTSKFQVPLLEGPEWRWLPFSGRM